jgi:hypothetical protein
LIGVFSFSGSKRSVMKRLYPHFIGEYRLVKIIDAKKSLAIESYKNIVQMRMTRKDKLIFINNGKKVKQYTIFEMLSPLDENPNHLFYGTLNEYEPPMYYSGDTMITVSYPVEYADNYFVKINH